MSFTNTRVGDHTTARCDHCRFEVTYRGEPGPTARNSIRAHDCRDARRKP